jgi:hypothetical protein
VALNEFYFLISVENFMNYASPLTKKSTSFIMKRRATVPQFLAHQTYNVLQLYEHTFANKPQKLYVYIYCALKTSNPTNHK